MTARPLLAPPGRRDGFWIRTASGGRFYPLDPREREVRIEDVAHALSNLCRFAGHVREFYSVAQHSVHVSEWVEREALERGHGATSARRLALEGLLHDASEAYLNDVATPVKRQPELAGYRAAEARLSSVIRRRFDLPIEESRIVKQGDQAVLQAEARDLMAGGLDGFGTYDVPPADWTIWPAAPSLAKEYFLERFSELGGAA